MQEIRGNARIYLAILLIASAISAIFWTAFQANAYNTFTDSYYDIGIVTYSTSFSLHNPGIDSGLQLLVFENHIAPDQLLMLPIYALFQSPITLIAVQNIIISMASLLVFIILFEFSKNEHLAFIFAIIYLLNPGIMGIMLFDYHPEFLIIPFFLTSFYFFMKNNKGLFAISLILLLCTIDTVVFTTIALGLGLLYYSIVYTEGQDRKAKTSMSVYIILVSILFLVLYMDATSILTQQYATAYSQLSPYLRIVPFDSILTNNLFGNIINLHGNFSFYSQAITNVSWSSPDLLYLFLGLFVAILTFGIAVLADPIIVLLLAAPWLIEFLVLGHFGFANVNFEYYSYVIANSIVAATLGIIIINKKRGLFKKMNLKMIFTKNGTQIVAMSAIIISIYAIAMGMDVIATGHDLAFWSSSNSTTAQCSSQLNGIISQIPQNASIMAQVFVIPHIANWRYIETPGVPGVQNDGIYFNPEYIIYVSNGCFDSFTAPGVYYTFANMYIANYTRSNGYALVAQNGTAELYKSATTT